MSQVMGSQACPHLESTLMEERVESLKGPSPLHQGFEVQRKVAVPRILSSLYT